MAHAHMWHHFLNIQPLAADAALATPLHLHSMATQVRALVPCLCSIFACPNPFSSVKAIMIQVVVTGHPPTTPSARHQLR